MADTNHPPRHSKLSVVEPGVNNLQQASSGPSVVASSTPATTKSMAATKASAAAAASLPPLQEHSCEICGAAGLTDDGMREHTRTCHVEGSAQCPFCGLSGVAPAELLLHVNQAHLDYLTPDNELISFIDDQSPSVDGDSGDSMSECPNGYSSRQKCKPQHSQQHLQHQHQHQHQPQHNHSQPSTNCGGARPDMATKLNGGACTNGHVDRPRSTHHRGHHTKITSFYKKSMSADAPHTDHNHQQQQQQQHQMCCGSASPAASTAAAHRAMHALKATHETRSCDNQDVLGAGGQGAHGSAQQQPQQQSETTVTTSNGGEGSPLRSQLGLNLKSHKPAATKPSPLQCPMCPYTSDSSNILEEHINRSHFDPLSPSMNNSNNSGSGNRHGSNASASGSSAATTASSSSSSSTAGTATNGDGHAFQAQSLQQQQHPQQVDTLTALACPICGQAFEKAPSLELHVNIEHRDILSPAAAKQSSQTAGTSVVTGITVDNASAGGTMEVDGAAAAPAAPRTPSCCPICSCSLDGWSQPQMEVHIEAHFPHSPQPQLGAASGGATSGSAGVGATKADGPNGGLVGAVGGIAIASGASCAGPIAAGAAAAVDLEKQAQKLREQREFEALRAQYGMDDQGNFREQSAAGMQRAVYAGEMSVADYYERQVGLRAAESHGIDDGTSCTRSVAPRVASLSAGSPNVMRSLMCSAVDHYASSYGDKGWGCGYRNLQMLLSSLLQNTTYNEALYSAWGTQGPSRTAMPSISRLQKMVEAAWAQGFDVQGKEQLGCKLYNTRKWIGATEVVTVLSWLRINCQLIDFHRPTSADGRHPDLFTWVMQYFEEPAMHTPPLYLQHQGHSRTIIGIEQRANGPQLLILDPSHGPRQVAALGSSQDSLRLIRRGSNAMRAQQYQIVAIRGLIETEDEYQANKVLRSRRIPPDC